MNMPTYQGGTTEMRGVGVYGFRCVGEVYGMVGGVLESPPYGIYTK